MEFDKTNTGWYSPRDLVPKSFRCGYCSNLISSVRGYKIGHHEDGSGVQKGGIYICPHCNGPTYVNVDGAQFPDVPFGEEVKHLPKSLSDIYNEARKCTSNTAYTAAVLLTRKLLMHIAVEQGAKQGESFVYYVEYLAKQGYVPPNGKHWVDHIRKKGNEANHEITIMTRDDARELMMFSEMLMKFIYEFPKAIPPPNPNG